MTRRTRMDVNTLVTRRAMKQPALVMKDTSWVPIKSLAIKVSGLQLICKITVFPKPRNDIPVKSSGRRKTDFVGFDIFVLSS